MTIPASLMNQDSNVASQMMTFAIPLGAILLNGRTPMHRFKVESRRRT